MCAALRSEQTIYPSEYSARSVRTELRSIGLLCLNRLTWQFGFACAACVLLVGCQSASGPSARWFAKTPPAQQVAHFEQECRQFKVPAGSREMRDCVRQRWTAAYHNAQADAARRRQAAAAMMGAMSEHHYRRAETYGTPQTTNCRYIPGSNVGSPPRGINCVSN